MDKDTHNLFTSIISLIVIGVLVMQCALLLDEHNKQSKNPVEKNITIFDKYTTLPLSLTGGFEYKVLYSIENSTDIIQENNISLYYHVETGHTYKAVFTNENSTQRIGLL